jgi:hypothetical protein
MRRKSKHPRHWLEQDSSCVLHFLLLCLIERDIRKAGIKTVSTSLPERCTHHNAQIKASYPRDGRRLRARANIPTIAESHYQIYRVDAIVVQVVVLYLGA